MGQAGLTEALSARPLKGCFVVSPDLSAPDLQRIAYWEGADLRPVAGRVRALQWSAAARRLAFYREPEYEFTLAEGLPAYALKQANGLFLFDPAANALSLVVEGLAPVLCYHRPPATSPPSIRWSADGRYLWLCHGSVWPTGTSADAEGPVAALVQLEVARAAGGEERFAARGWAEGLWLSPGERWCAVKMFLTQGGTSVVERVVFVPARERAAGPTVVDAAALPGLHQRFVAWVSEDVAVVATGDDPNALRLAALEMPRE